MDPGCFPALVELSTDELFAVAVRVKVDRSSGYNADQVGTEALEQGPRTFDAWYGE